MDSNSGLVRYDEPAKDAISIPAHLQEAARWCADNGIPLHDARNPHDELRAWASYSRNERMGRQLLNLKMLAANVQHKDRFEGHVRYVRERREMRAKKIAKRRKLQKQRGVR